MRVIWVGLGLTAVAGIAAFLMYLSPAVAMTAVVFGLLATRLQYMAVRLAVQVPQDAPFAEHVKGYGRGMALRLVGVVVLLVLCTAWPAYFPAIGAAIGYLGVLIPLLFLEMRTSR
ncbi:MAG TPA: hypothetical protein VF454_02170 [Gemmatimonadales bacterium]